MGSTFLCPKPNLKQHLRRRGYPEHLLTSEIQRATSTPRDAALRHRTRDKTTRIPLVVTYNPTLPSLGQVTRAHHHILQASDRLKRAVPSPPIIAFRRPRSLRDLLVHAEIKPLTRRAPGNSRCGASRCKTCPILLTTKEFTSHSTGRKYTIRTSATCKSSNVIYLIQCKKCGLQYVGETGQALHCRMNNHRADITHRRTHEKPVTQHFTTSGHSVEDMGVLVIETLWREDPVLRKIRESKWIRALETSCPKGMNLRVDSL